MTSQMDAGDLLFRWYSTASLLVVHIFKALTESCDKLESGSVRNNVAFAQLYHRPINQEVSGPKS